MPDQFPSDRSCECGWLVDAAAEPAAPIEFDATLSEYHLVYECADRVKVRMMLNYCPFCGGSAPQSRRSLMFAALTQQELRRLGKLTKGLATIADVLDTLGTPELDSALPMTTHLQSSGCPPVAEVVRSMTYASLSETADVHVTEGTDGRVRIRFTGKYIGPPATDTAADLGE